MEIPGSGRLAFVLLIIIISGASSMPTKDATTTTTTRRPQIGDTIKQLTNQLMNTNTTSQDITLDVRTPPKVKQQLKKTAHKDDVSEKFDPGVAVTMEDADLVMEANTKKFNFYKIEQKPTTDRGLSTWVLLNSQTVPPAFPTTKITRKPTIKDETKNLTAIDVETPNKIIKPVFKKRPVTTTTTTTTTTKKPNVTTEAEKNQKPIKVKASVLSNALNVKNKTDISKNSTISITLEEVSTMKPNSSTTKTSTTLSINDNEVIPSLEAKYDEFELMPTTSAPKKGRRPTTKRKKNKKRRRPNLDKLDTNTTKLANKVSLKEKPISTQIYNYLSREIIPTVGVGLVGLVVTAGLASYFLYPFGGLRRSYEVDRKDKEGSYYYNDEYAPGGMAEEDVIGKVIAGMPNSYQNYRTPTSRDAYSSFRHKQSDYVKTQEPPAYVTPSKTYGDGKMSHWNHNYNKEIIEHSQETGYTVEDKQKQFVVGNIPQESQEATPAVVPEHGPRNLPELTTPESLQGVSDYSVVRQAPRGRLEIFSKNHKLNRKRRSNDFENEISSNDESLIPTTESTSSSTIATTSENGMGSLLGTVGRLVETSVRMALEFLRLTTRDISKYFSRVQKRFEKNYSNSKSKEQPRMH